MRRFPIIREQSLQLREEASSGSSVDEAETVVDDSGEDKALDQHSQDLLNGCSNSGLARSPLLMR